MNAFLSLALLALTLLAACSEKDVRLMPIGDIEKLDSVTREKIGNTLTDEERDALALAATSYRDDTLAMKRRTLGELIDEGMKLKQNRGRTP
jgi:hypothetical protein